MCKRYRNLVEFFIDHGVMIGRNEFNLAFYGVLLLIILLAVGSAYLGL